MYNSIDVPPGSPITRVKIYSKPEAFPSVMPPLRTSTQAGKYDTKMGEELENMRE